MTKRDITSGDIYDQLKIPAKQQPVQMDFWDALPGYIYGAEQIAKIQLTIGLPAVLIRVLLHLWVLDGMHTVTFALILLLELPLFALLFPIRCMVRYAACNDPDWPLLLTREENRAFWTQRSTFLTMCRWYLAPAAASTLPLLFVALALLAPDSRELLEAAYLVSLSLGGFTVGLTLICRWFSELATIERNRAAARQIEDAKREREGLRGPPSVLGQAELQLHFEQELDDYRRKSTHG